jgi:uncharacterized protein YbjT (DUF2867 family)/quercetin dioxygenase-like cupin family protein
MANVLVTGGTAALGREVVLQLLAHHHMPRVLSRQSQPDLPPGVEIVSGDLVSGQGLAEAVAGVEAIVHCASNPQAPEAADIGGTHLLVQAAQEAGAPHFIYVSIVGVERATAGYYRAKHEAERVVAQSQLPWSIVRATQFHTFALRLVQSLGADSLNVLPVPPGVRLQPVSIADVAERLVALTEEGPLRRVLKFGGPQILTLEEMIQSYLSWRGRAATQRTVEFPGSLFATFSSDGQLCPEAASGKQTWNDFLRSWYGEHEGYPTAKKETTILMEQIVQLPNPSQVTVHTVAFEPGAQGPFPHRHPGPIFGYVVEGEVLFEMRGHTPRIYRKGDVFYEPDGCFHLLTNNPSPTRRALLLAVLIGVPGEPILTVVPLQKDTNEPIEPIPHMCS